MSPNKNGHLKSFLKKKPGNIISDNSNLCDINRQEKEKKAY